MAIGLGEEQRALATAVADWATGLSTHALVRRSETEGTSVFDEVAKGLHDLGLAGIALRETRGGGGGGGDGPRGADPDCGCGVGVG